MSLNSLPSPCKGVWGSLRREDRAAYARERQTRGELRPGVLPEPLGPMSVRDKLSSGRTQVAAASAALGSSMQLPLSAVSARSIGRQTETAMLQTRPGHAAAAAGPSWTRGRATLHRGRPRCARGRVKLTAAGPCCTRSRAMLYSAPSHRSNPVPIATHGGSTLLREALPLGLGFYFRFRSQRPSARLEELCIVGAPSFLAPRPSWRLVLVGGRPAPKAGRWWPQRRRKSLWSR